MKNTILVAALAAASLATVTQVQAHKEGDFILRVDAAHISPNDDSSGVLSSTDGVSVSSTTGLGFSGTWMLSDNWGFEVLAALPFEHDIKGTGDLAGVDIGSTKQLPPTLSVQYYPTIESETLTPYVGLGLNYTRFFEEEASSELKTALGTNDVKLVLDDSFGIAAQAGADWKVNEDFYINTSFWYMQIDTKAAVKVDGTTATTVNVDIDPWVAMVGVTWKF